MFKSLKRAVVSAISGDAQPKFHDAEYDRSKQQFGILSSTIDEVHKSIEEYRASMLVQCRAASGAVDALALLFPKPSANPVASHPPELTGSMASLAAANGVVTAAAGASHGYASLAHFSKARLHSLLSSSDRLEACERRLTNGAVAQAQELQEKCRALKERLVEREEALEELEHYASKTAGLQREQAKLLAQGKKETPKDEERRVRNQNNTSKLRAEFVALNTALTREMSAYWEKRLDLLTPILLEFLSAQSKFSSELAECSGEIVREREKATKSSPPIDFSTVLYQVMTSAGAPTPRRTRTWSDSQSKGRESESGGSNNGAHPLQHNQHHTTGGSTFVRPEDSPPMEPTKPSQQHHPVPPPIPMIAGALGNTSSYGSGPPPLPTTTAGHHPSPSPLLASSGATAQQPPSHKLPPPLPSAAPAQQQAGLSLHTSASPPSSVPPSPVSSTTTLSTQPAIPARPTLPPRKPGGAAAATLKSYASGGTATPPAPAAQAALAPPSVAPAVAASASTSVSPPPLPIGLLPSPSPDPNHSSSSSSSTIAAAAASAALDASYSKALKATAAPSFVSTSRNTNLPPPLPPSSADPEPWAPEEKREFGKMHERMRKEMEEMELLPKQGRS